MAINPHLCSFCNQKKSTVAIGLDGQIPSIIYKKSKYGIKVESDEKWDRATRYLCYDCIVSQCAGVRIGRYDVIRDQKTQIRIPRTSTIIFFQNKERIRIPVYWHEVNKVFECWLEIGSYDFIRIDEIKKPKRQRENKKAPTPMFGDLTGGMMDFNESQGHQKK